MFLAKKKVRVLEQENLEIPVVTQTTPLPAHDILFSPSLYHLSLTLSLCMTKLTISQAKKKKKNTQNSKFL